MALVRIGANVGEAGSGRASRAALSVRHHPYDYYIGLKSVTGTVVAGDTVEVECVVINYDGTIRTDVTHLDYQVFQRFREYAHIWVPEINGFRWEHSFRRYPTAGRGEGEKNSPGQEILSGGFAFRADRQPRWSPGGPTSMDNRYRERAGDVRGVARRKILRDLCRFLLGRRVGMVAVVVALAAHLALWLVPLPHGLFPETSFVVRYESGEMMRVYLTADEKWRLWVPLDEIDPRLISATLCYEDRYFWWHPGVNPGALVRALVQNARAGRILSGGSTITMQVARLAERRPRTLLAKVIEMLRAVQYEVRLGKRRILENYLNRAPYGGNYEGVASASLAYFGKMPSRLTVGEIAYLVSLPQSPTRRRPGPDIERRAKSARNRVLARLEECGVISEAEYREALTADLPDRARGMPFRAPLTADYFRRRFPGAREVRTTLSPRVQTLAESFLAAHRPRLRALGAYNAAVVVMENETRKVRALVGTLDYRDDDHAGKMTTFDRFRSPGSALKPFLYALALQEGVITTQTLLEDIPEPISGFLPANFSRTYRGMVPAEFALSHSLNYPFVRLLKAVSPEKFLRLTTRLGLQPDPNLEYGLTAVTGGLEVRLLDLTNAYVTFARSGRIGLARLRPEERLTESAVLNPGAVSLTLEALSLRERPDAPADLSLAEGHRRTVIYWKTGTSWGRRDAWSIGLTADYTVGVWVGNLSGRGADGITGSGAAAPLMFDLLEALGSRSPKIPEATAELETVKVCALSGLPPNPRCPEVKSVRVVRDHLPAQQCPLHRAFIVERTSGYLACPTVDYPPGSLEVRVVAVVPALARPLMSLPQSGVPAPSPECAGSSPESTLRLIRPTSGATYLMTSGVRRATRIVLEAYTTDPYGEIFWFLDGRFIARTRNGEIHELAPGPGVKTIVAVDRSGSTARATISVYASRS